MLSYWYSVLNHKVHRNSISFGRCVELPFQSNNKENYWNHVYFSSEYVSHLGVILKVTLDLKNQQRILFY